ncbi:MAG: hypothetical protein JOZ78_07200 [Chroococcidiopsidaceae cyanobacterium CP_BM_ER_R8_30]|nr:hypothetical protein [Chroococcidiopsidaceae cyanobacterium CP_BM_ER_R8_30]
MAFIKVENIVINTNYIAAVKLENLTVSGEESVSILLATPKFPLLQLESAFPSPYHYEWLDFTGSQANVLRDYFSSFNNVVDLMPQI